MDSETRTSLEKPEWIWKTFTPTMAQNRVLEQAHQQNKLVRAKIMYGSTGKYLLRVEIVNE